MATSKQGPKIGAKTAKVKGTGTVTPKASEDDKAPASPEASAVAEEAEQVVDNGASTDEHPEAYQAGWAASVHGAKGRPPLEYSDEEVRAWYRGYKAHANPNAETPVAGIQAGYRQDY